MSKRGAGFNVILTLCAALLLATQYACKTASDVEGKEGSLMGLFLQASENNSVRSQRVPIFRDQPVYLNVEEDPFLTEAEIESAAVTDEVGGFSLSLQFSRHGQLLLETVTTGNIGKRIAVYGQFGATNRWLGAPLISGRIANGKLTFVPDATREEADRFARGLNNFSKLIDEKGLRF